MALGLHVNRNEIAIGRRRQPERGKMTASADPDPMSSLLNFFIFDSSRHVSENEVGEI